MKELERAQVIVVAFSSWVGGISTGILWGFVGADSDALAWWVVWTLTATVTVATVARLWRGQE